MTRRQGIDRCDVAVIGSGFGGAIAAFRSSSRVRMLRWESISSAFSTMPTAPSTIRKRAATMALACWR